MGHGFARCVCNCVYCVWVPYVCASSIKVLCVYQGVMIMHVQARNQVLSKGGSFFPQFEAPSAEMGLVRDGVGPFHSRKFKQ